MPELSRRDWAIMNLIQVKRQLLDAAASGKTLTPEQLENAAGNISEGLRVFRSETEPRPADA